MQRAIDKQNKFVFRTMRQLVFLGRIAVGSHSQRSGIDSRRPGILFRCSSIYYQQTVFDSYFLHRSKSASWFRMKSLLVQDRWSIQNWNSESAEWPRSGHHEVDFHEVSKNFPWISIKCQTQLKLINHFYLAW